MAFVNEKIPEADQESINYGALRDPQGGRPLVDSTLPRWAVDRERDAFLLRLGGGATREDYQVPFYFLFCWQGARMRVDAYRRIQTSSAPKFKTLTWEIIRLHLPETLPASLEETMQMLSEAFDTYGSNSYDDSKALYSAVNVDFSKTMHVDKGE
ncbi:MAG: hypothetical protein AB7F21_02915 [Desulfuromonadales bacterium]